jgi:hypothetical protein
MEFDGTSLELCPAEVFDVFVNSARSVFPSLESRKMFLFGRKIRKTQHLQAHLI